jgi:proteasome lid subunit RPN8/RPN11
MWGDRREVLEAVYYDDLAPEALADGMILFPSYAYSALWRTCRDRSLQVVADIHTHPGIARQSHTDSEHPMIPKPGHIAIIAPNFAQGSISDANLGVYEYLGGHQWKNRSYPHSSHFFIRPIL